MNLRWSKSSQLLQRVAFLVVFIFVDGIFILICISKLNPGQVYNGHKREDGITFQSTWDSGKVEDIITQCFLNSAF